MKKTPILIIYLFLNQVLLSQNIDKLEFPTTVKPEISQSISKYLYVKSEENAQKLDSLKTTEQKHFKKNIIGVWEYFDSECSCCVKKKNKKKITKYIKITEDRIFFYKRKISKKNLTQTEKLEFASQYDIFSDLTSLVFKDNSIWSFKVDKTNNYLKIYNSGKESENGRSSFVSGIITEYYKRIE
ncbi:hypothetical protein [Mesonia aestuariivivens]|uniref:DUF4468 domain-containing protein n=1 Tax=Mesonia aestuariivivens TaxID=2796128 RepID=A0ABS6W5G9_9FLAO|nr:hypothetical protein [Mesonia aestuariivivens]MBW2963117.1 hypothetical protein [Mesonia aestuariivivens]